MVLRRSLWFGFLTIASLLWVCPSIRAGSMSSVSFQCASLVVNGRSGRCTSPPLVLYPDGKYKIWGDRKSTRLNSSHLVISYAVFCLKKKKNCDPCLGQSIMQADP